MLYSERDDAAMEKMNWCFIGAGRLAHTVAKQIRYFGGQKIVSVYARRYDNCREFADLCGATAYTSAKDAILDPRVEAVYIVTPHNSHYEYARLALELGKPVLLEKPFTVSAAQTDDLIALARSKGVYIAEAMWTWYAPVANQVRQWVTSGRLGKIEYAELTYCSDFADDAPRLLDPQRAGGALLDIGVYPLTYLYRLFGTPEEMTCTGTLRDGVDLGETVRMRFADCPEAVARISFADPNFSEHLILRGDKGQIRCQLYHMANSIVLTCADGTREEFRGNGNYRNEFSVVASEIHRGLTESELVPLGATSAVMHLMDECRRQMGLRYDCE